MQTRRLRPAHRVSLLLLLLLVCCSAAAARQEELHLEDGAARAGMVGRWEGGRGSGTRENTTWGSAP